MSNNPLTFDLEKTIPGVSITLPTLGRFYPDGTLSPNVDAASPLMVNPFSVFDEMAWRDPYSIMSGDAYRGIMERCVPWVTSPEKLASFDVQVIFLAARQATYGPNYTIEIECQNPALTPDEDGKPKPKCREKNKSTVSIPVLLSRYTPINDPENWFVKLSNGQTVYFHPLLYSEEMKSYKFSFEIQKRYQNLNVDSSDFDQAIDARLEARHETLKFAKQLRMMQYIGSIRGVATKENPDSLITDRRHITEWVIRLPSSEVGLIDQSLKKLTDRFANLTSDMVECSTCGHHTSVSLLDDPQAFFGQSSTD